MVEVLTDTVEDNNRVVDRETNHRKGCRHKHRVNLPVEQITQPTEDANQNRNVMQHRDNRRNAKRQAILKPANREPEGEVEDNKEAGEQHRCQGISSQLSRDC